MSCGNCLFLVCSRNSGRGRVCATALICQTSSYRSNSLRDLPEEYTRKVRTASHAAPPQTYSSPPASASSAAVRGISHHTELYCRLIKSGVQIKKIYVKKNHTSCPETVAKSFLVLSAFCEASLVLRKWSLILEPCYTLSKMGQGSNSVGEYLPNIHRVSPQHNKYTSHFMDWILPFDVCNIRNSDQNLKSTNFSRWLGQPSPHSDFQKGWD